MPTKLKNSKIKKKQKTLSRVEKSFASQAFLCLDRFHFYPLKECLKRKWPFYSIIKEQFFHKSIIFACKSGDHIMLLLSRQLKKEHRVEYVSCVMEMSTMFKFNINAALKTYCYLKILTGNFHLLSIWPVYSFISLLFNFLKFHV